MNEQWTISRRSVLSLASCAVAAPLLAAVYSLLGRTPALQERRRVTITADAARDVTFVDGVILARTGGRMHVLSSRCTHLGCEITQQADGFLQCPCHGSRFRLDGTVERGPAARPLEALAHKVDPHTGAIVVEV